MERTARVKPLLVFLTAACSACGPVSWQDHEHVSACAPAAAPPAFAIGTWTGLGQQSGGISWPMIVHVTSLDAGPCAEVEYPTIPCGGQWICREPFDGGTLVAEERLSFGHDQCVDHVDVSLGPGEGDTLSVHFRAPGVTAAATLRRE